MNKAEFIDAVAAKAGLSKKDAKGAVDAVLDTITEALVKKDSVSFIGFGTFSTAGIENFIHVRVNVLDTLKEFNAKLLK
jgi:DNA-binding protein HU-beta